MSTKEVIDLSKQHYIGAEDLKDRLNELRRYVFRLANNLSDEADEIMSIRDFADVMFILNWLIDDVEFIDSKNHGGDNEEL